MEVESLERAESMISTNESFILNRLKAVEKSPEDIIKVHTHTHTHTQSLTDTHTHTQLYFCAFITLLLLVCVYLVGGPGQLRSW